MVALSIIFFLFLILLFAPRQSYPWVLALTVPVYAWLWWVISRPLPSTDNWGDLDRAIVSLAMMFGITPAIFRLLLTHRRGPDLPSDLNWKPTQATCLFVMIWFGAWILTPAIPAVIGANRCIVAALTVNIVLVGISRFSGHYRLFVTTAAGALITGIIAVLVWPLSVVAAAEEKAAGRPYCLVVADGLGYRTARNLMDLTPLVMRGQESGRSASNFHGQLLISGESHRNWSYARIGFFDTSIDNNPPKCKDMIGFARNLRWL